jgi:hypothetical protein
MAPKASEFQSVVHRLLILRKNKRRLKSLVYFSQKFLSPCNSTNISPVVGSAFVTWFLILTKEFELQYFNNKQSADGKSCS